MFDPKSSRRRFVQTTAAGVCGSAVVGTHTRTANSQQQPSPVSNVTEAQAATVRIQAQGTYTYPDENLSAQTAESVGGGTGFFVDPSGIAVTNNHVVTGAGSLVVFVGGDDSRQESARVLGVSECSDLAVIEVSGGGYPYFEWFDGRVSPGLPVSAVGYPVGPDGTQQYQFSEGSIASEARPLSTTWASVDEMIQHSAVIRPGSSGGPLLHGRTARVVGVNYAGSTELDTYLAISSASARGITAQLRTGRDVESIGVNGLAVLNQEGSISGVWAVGVEPGGPASDAGVQAGDILTQLQGVSLGLDGTMSSYCQVLRSHTPGDVMSVQVLRYETGELLAGELNGRPLEPIAGSSPGDDSANLTSGDGYSGYEDIVDATGAIAVTVPTEWADRDLRPLEVGPSITASTDVQSFNQTFDVPGVFFVASSGLGTDPAGILQQLAVQGCTSEQPQSYDDGYYTGLSQIQRSCGGGETVLANIGATSPDDSYGVGVQVQIVEERDFEALDTIILSFRAIDEAKVP
ncbi:S1C family serine protease [Haloprofundus salilacus]|uniref:S1C family serine protease n=1 Tax=Haloprofundus salilacus TaxID=2876190 RepID=UPI001CCE68D5|nr:S1C family serine protease [Haloprofundus salilacus]